MAQALPHPIMYAPAGQQVLPAYVPQYYPMTMQSNSMAYSHFAPSYPERHKPERRRPKYTRSKTGCLTCRKKKVKCDEAKPMCQRCHNSQLDCAWPEVVPSKKKIPPRKKSSSVDQDSTIDGTFPYSSTPTTDQEPSLLSSRVSETSLTEGRQSAPLLKLPDPDLLHVESGVAGDRRHSEPHLHNPLPLPAISGRRHTVPDIADGQYDQLPLGYAPNVNVSSGGALGLSMHRFNHVQPNANTRSSTPSEYLYPQHNAQGYSYSPAGHVQALPGLSGASTSSRPSTASSLSLSQPMTFRGSSSSRPSTAGSIPNPHYAHRPSSSSAASGEPVFLGLAPGSFQLNGSRGPDLDMSLDSRNGVSISAPMQAFSSASRPSTANSAASASPFMRNMSHSSDSGIGPERWQTANPSPLMHSTPLMQSMPSQAVEGYFPSSLHSTPQHSRSQSPWAR